MKTVNTNKAPEALGPYSHATVVNDLSLYIRSNSINT